jgi:hypothetical protein
MANIRGPSSNGGKIYIIFYVVSTARTRAVDSIATFSLPENAKEFVESAHADKFNICAYTPTSHNSVSWQRVKKNVVILFIDACIIIRVYTYLLYRVSRPVLLLKSCGKNVQKYHVKKNMMPDRKKKGEK